MHTLENPTPQDTETPGSSPCSDALGSAENVDQFLDTQPEPMNPENEDGPESEADPRFNEQHRATYCPEDNKLRLYVGRVPRPEYEALRAEGWTSTPKQECDFVTTWTPTRRDTATAYAGIIEDEDQGPEDRAADRAERFNGYLDKRIDDATGHADRYDSRPSAHGFQSQRKAETAARRHDRIGTRATDAWSKAEYWQRRTAGVISHAMHKCDPGVRMGRIKVLEADLRRATPGGQWHTHLTLRLAYENQMLEAQGGRAGALEIICGGWIRGGRRLGSEERQIVKVNKSPKTGRVVSVLVRDNKPSTHNHYGNPYPEGVTKTLIHQIEVERMDRDAYRAPTPEELAEFEAKEKAAKKSAKASAAPAIPLINPTNEDAERLQALWNDQAMEERIASYKRMGYGLPVTDCAPVAVVYMTQASYSEQSRGTYARAGTREVFAGGHECDSHYNALEKGREKHGKELCQIRRTTGSNGNAIYSASRVIVLTDKPQKPLPAEVWPAPTFTLEA